MSRNEFEKFMKGEQLWNPNTHENQKTNSKGFCFLNLDEYKPEEALHFLTGIVNFEVCAIFEVEEKILNKTWGIYAKPLEKNYNEESPIASIFKILYGYTDSFRANEYCISSYSKRKFNLIKYAIPNWNNREKWEWFQGWKNGEGEK
jgi:hypothetical protein